MIADNTMAEILEKYYHDRDRRKVKNFSMDKPELKVLIQKIVQKDILVAKANLMSYCSVEARKMSGADELFSLAKIVWETVASRR